MRLSVLRRALISIKQLGGSRRKPNLLILGASGGVANAFLHHLNGYRDAFDSLVLLDGHDDVLRDEYIDHEALRYIFLKVKVNVRQPAAYQRLLQRHHIDIVLDLTDADSLPLLDATNAVGVSYINTALNDAKLTVTELMNNVYPRKEQLNKAAHILCTGMNPGVVNMWVRYGIEKYGRPKQITHFEFDTAKTLAKWHPLITWSIHEFLVEMVRDPSGIALGGGRVKQLLPNAIEHRKNLKGILEPIMKLRQYPEAFTVLHEENLSISYKYNVPSQFFYAIHPDTARRVVEIFEKTGNVTRSDLELGDNTSDILEGSDNIGVILEYSDKKIYYLNSIANGAVVGTNATYTQVIVGIFAALFTLINDRPKPGAYFVEDLYETTFPGFLFDNMRIQEFVFHRRGSRFKLAHYNPMLKEHRRKPEHLYVI